MISPLLKLALSAMVAIGLVSCAQTREQRIAQNAGYFSTLSPADQAAVTQGQLRVGMPRDAVVLALGKPSGLSERVGPAGSEEVLSYVGYQAVYTYPRFPIAPAYDRYERCVHIVDPGPDIVHVPYVKSRVFLRQGKVTSWVQDKPRR